MSEITGSQNFEPLYAALRELGLTENEQRLYVISIANGPSSISRLAELITIPRPNLYKVISGLEKQGLAKLPEHKRYSRRFSVEPPSVITDLLRKKRESESKIDRSFIERLPVYLSQYQQGEAPMKIKVLTGKEDFIAAFNRMFEETGDELLYFGSITDLAKGIGRDVVSQNSKIRADKKVRARTILLPADQNYLSPQTHIEQLREVRYLTTTPTFVTSFHVFANKVILWQPVGATAVLIEDEYLVQMFKSIFTGFWEIAQPLPM